MLQVIRNTYVIRMIVGMPAMSTEMWGKEASKES